MNLSPRTNVPRIPWWLLLTPLVLSAALRDLWAPDEPRYAMVSKWIYDHGDFLVLRRCGALYPDKPPMLYWIAGLCGFLSDWSTLAMRSISLLSMAAVAWSTRRIALRWFGELEALWAPILFLGFFMVVEIGGRLQIDPLLTMGCVGALDLATTPARDPRHARRLVLAAGALAGLGIFSKGPVGLINIGLPIVLWRLHSSCPDAPRVSKRIWAFAIAMSLLPVVTWAALASLAEPSLASALFFGQHLGRVSQGTAHPGPPWQNILRMPGLLMPWAIPVILGIVAATRVLFRRWRGATVHAGLLSTALWFWGLFLFFSIIPTKRDMYLLSAYPACALLGAHWIANVLRGAPLGRTVALVPIVLFALIGVLGTVLLPLVPWSAERWPKLAATATTIAELRALHPTLVLRASLVGATFAIGAGLALVAWRRAHVASWLNAITLTWLVGLCALIVLIVPVVDPLKSDRGTAALLTSLAQRPSEIPCYGTAPDGVRFYGGHPSVEAHPREWRDGSFERRLAEEGANFVALFEDDDFARMPEPLRERLTILGEERTGSRRVLIVGAR